MRSVGRNRGREDESVEKIQWEQLKAGREATVGNFQTFRALWCNSECKLWCWQAHWAQHMVCDGVVGRLCRCRDILETAIPSAHFYHELTSLKTSDGNQTATEQDLKSIGLFCLVRFKIHGTLLSSYLLKTLMKSLKLRYVWGPDFANSILKKRLHLKPYNEVGGEQISAPEMCCDSRNLNRYPENSQLRR